MAFTTRVDSNRQSRIVGLPSYTARTAGCVAGTIPCGAQILDQRIGLVRTQHREKFGELLMCRDITGLED